jgi:hypothetical protein
MALKRTNIETHACGRDASEYHVSAALSASRAMDVEIDLVRQEIRFLHEASLLQEGGGGQQEYCPEATLLWREQLALKPVHYVFGLQRITELYRRLKLMRTTMTFKGPKVIT